MKTTIDVAQSLLDEARSVARRDGTTLRALVEEGLRAALDRRGERAFEYRPVTYGGTGTQPGVDLESWQQVRDVIYADRDA